MTTQDEQNDRIGKTALLLSGVVCFPTIVLPGIGIWYGWKALKFVGKSVSRTVAAAAKHREQVAIAREHRKACQALIAERERRAVAEERKLLAQPPEPTKTESLAELQRVLATTLAGIERLPLPEDEKTALRNQAMDAFMSSLAEAMR